jgi:hypothetical protein
MSVDQKSCVETAAIANSTFLSNLERWLDSTIECNLEKGQTDLVKIALDKYKQAMRANIEFHTISATLYENEPTENKSPFYYRHKLLTEIYKSILGETR